MVKFGKKFFFNATYAKKNRTASIIIVSTVILLIVTTFFITSNFYNNSTANNSVIELYEKNNIKLFDRLPYMLSYFKTIENVKIKDIKILYPDNFSYIEDTIGCSEEQITLINSIKNGQNTEANIEEAFSCISYKTNIAGEFNVKIQIGKKEFNTILNVIDDEIPQLIAKDFEIYEDETYNVDDFVESCSDNSQQKCDVNFLNTSIVDYSKFKDPGTYQIKIQAEDNSGNKSEAQTVNLTIKKIIYYNVTFNSNGGSAVESQTIREGETIKYPTTPTKEGHSFEGWYYNNKEFDLNTPITSDITITAKWKKIQTSNGSSGGGGNYYPGGGSKPNNNNQCIKYSDVYQDVSIYNYQFTNGSSKDCMTTTNYSEQAIKLAQTYKDEIQRDYIDYYLYGAYCPNISINFNNDIIRVTGNRIVGYKLTVSLSCNGSNEKTYEFHCSSQNSCTYY